MRTLTALSAFALPCCALVCCERGLTAQQIDDQRFRPIDVFQLEYAADCILPVLQPLREIEIWLTLNGSP